jgi:hypothetical protein
MNVQPIRPVDQPQPLPVPIPPAASPAREFFEFVSKHVVLVTGLAAVLGIALATAGLYAYLCVFDRRLIWVIEYPDVLRWGLVALAIVSGFSFTAWSLIDDGFVWASKSQWKNAKIAFGVWTAVWLVVLALQYFFGSKPFHWEGALWTYLFFVSLALAAVSTTMTFRQPVLQMRHIMGDVAILIFLAATAGSMVGYTVRDSAGFKEHVTTKDKIEYRSVGVVIITSRYVVLWDRDHTVVLPVDDIARIEGQPLPGSSK